MNRPPVLKRASLYLLRLIIGLGVTFMLGGARSPAMDMVFEQFQIITPWQWFSLVTVGAAWPRLGAAGEQPASASGSRVSAFAPANDNSPAGEIACVS